MSKENSRVCSTCGEPIERPRSNGALTCRKCHVAKEKSRVERMTPERREEHRKKERSQEKARRDRMAPEERAAYLGKRRRQLEEWRSKQPLDYASKASKDYRKRHPEVIKAQNSQGKWAKWVKENPEKYRATTSAWRRRNRHKIRSYALKRLYGITLKDYQDLWDKQGGKCAVCGKTKKRTLAVDHDHKTGEIRGLLCDYCNRRLGYLGDSLEGFRETVRMFEAYLIRARENDRHKPDKQVS